MLYEVITRNILVVSGDPPVMGPYPDATAVFDIDSIGLTNVVQGLNVVKMVVRLKSQRPASRIADVSRNNFV